MLVLTTDWLFLASVREEGREGRERRKKRKKRKTWWCLIPFLFFSWPLIMTFFPFLSLLLSFFFLFPLPSLLTLLFFTHYLSLTFYLFGPLAFPAGANSGSYWDKSIFCNALQILTVSIWVFSNSQRIESKSKTLNHFDKAIEYFKRISNLWHLVL